MKKTILSLFAAAFAAASFAQSGNCSNSCAGGSCTPPGSILLYGEGSYSNLSSNNTSKFGAANPNTVDNPHKQTWKVSPGIGFNVNEYLTIGVDVNYTGSKTDYDRKTLNFAGGNLPFDRITSSDFGIGPFIRVTHCLGEHFFGFGQLTAHYIDGRESFRTVTQPIGGNSFNSDNKYKGVNASFVPVIGAMITKTIGLTFSVGGVSYEYRKNDYSNYLKGTTAPGSNFDGKSKNFNIDFGKQVNFGVQKYFGGHKMHRGHREPMDEMRKMDTQDDDGDDSNQGTQRRSKHRHE
ncbi:MAG: hypothetical protein ABI378_02500 [Chitinophagaceae bacterium]